MTILVAYAPSDAAKAALQTALDVARTTGERVVVVNAGPGGEHRTPSLVTEAQQQEVQAILDASGVESEFRQYARGRSTAQEIKDVAAELDPSLVVIGLRRRGGFGRFVMGSVSDELLQDIDQPVLCVKEYRGHTPQALSSVAETDPAVLDADPRSERYERPRPFAGARHAAEPDESAVITDADVQPFRGSSPL